MTPTTEHACECGSTIKLLGGNPGDTETYELWLTHHAGHERCSLSDARRIRDSHGFRNRSRPTYPRTS